MNASILHGWRREGMAQTLLAQNLPVGFVALLEGYFDVCPFKG